MNNLLAAGMVACLILPLHQYKKLAITVVEAGVPYELHFQGKHLVQVDAATGCIKREFPEVDGILLHVGFPVGDVRVMP